MAGTVRRLASMELNSKVGSSPATSMRMEPPNHPRFRASPAIQEDHVKLIQETEKKYDDRWGIGKVRCDKVIELPKELKSTIAFPAITQRIVNELIENGVEGWSLDKMRNKKILNFNDWTVQLV